MNYRSRIIEICARLERRKLVSGTDGNISHRADDNSMYVTATGTNKGYLTEEQILLQSFDGKILEGNLRSTREAGFHTRIYKERPDINAVIHTHPPYATAFACCGQVLPTNILTEVSAVLGKMAFAPYAPPGSAELVASLDGLLEGCNIIFLSNHGIIVMGETLEIAYNHMDALENAAKTIVMARSMGGVQVIPDL